MDESLEYKIRKFGGFKSALLGGEGFDVEGEGRIYIQTRNPSIYFMRGSKK